MILRLLRGMTQLGFAVLALVVLVCLLVVAQGQRDETRNSSAAIVLGAAQWDGAPSPVLQARLDHALDLYRRDQVRWIILTGGTGMGDSTSEAAAGREYLLAKGVAPTALLSEDQGVTTLRSLTNAASLARANGITSVLLVSDSYHMLRALKMAHDLGLDAFASPLHAKASLSAEEAAHVLREAGAYLFYLFARQ